MARETWSFLETTGKGLHETATKMASEARRISRLLGGRACGLITAEDAHGLIKEVESFGLQKIYLLTGNPPPPWTPEGCAQAVAALASKWSPQVLLFAATAVGSEVAARVVARLGSGLISCCVDFSRDGESLVARKAVCGGKAHMTLTWCGPPPYIATIDLEALEAVEERDRSLLEVVEEKVNVGPLRTTLLRHWQLDSREVDLTEARFVIGIGRPIIARAEEMARLEEVAECLGATLGASRLVIDSGLLPKHKQIGASGKWLNADVYLACGISGSSYHMMGVRGVKHLVAVNTDCDAPILKSAELGVVGDLFEVLPALTKLRNAEKEGCSA